MGRAVEHESFVHRRMYAIYLRRLRRLLQVLQGLLKGFWKSAKYSSQSTFKFSRRQIDPGSRGQDGELGFPEDVQWRYGLMAMGGTPGTPGQPAYQADVSCISSRDPCRHRATRSE